MTSSHEVEADQQERDPTTLAPRESQAAEHHVDLFLFDASLSLSLGLSSRFAWEARVPFRVVSVDASFSDAQGNDLPSFESTHHRDEVIAGVGDVGLGAKVRLLAPSLQEASRVDLSAGVTFPTGSVSDNPFELGRQGRTHQHIFFGTGTVDPYLGLSASRSFGAVDLALWSAARGSLYSGSRGFQSGARVTVGLAAGTRLGLDDWYFTLGPELYHEEPSSWDDGSEAVNSGRSDLSPLLGVFWDASEHIKPSLIVKKPFTLRTAGGQFNLPVVVTLGVEFNAGLFGESAEDDHDHGDAHEHADDHGDHHDHGGPEGDVVDVALGGERFSIEDALAPGKITVIDYWATWCHPCEHIDKRLRSLASEHPRLAVRRVEVVDADSPVVEQHLGDEGVSLPVVWIFDADGKRIHNLVGTAEAEVAKILQGLLRQPGPAGGDHDHGDHDGHDH